VLKRNQLHCVIRRVIFLAIFATDLVIISGTASQSQESCEDKASSAVPGEKKAPLSAHLLRKGTALIGQDDFPSAIKIFGEAVQLDPNNAAMYYKRGYAYQLNNEFDHAISDYTEAIRLDAGNSEAFLGRGVCYDSKEEHDKANADFFRAITACNKAIARNGRDAEAYIVRACAHEYLGINARSLDERNGEISKSIADFTDAIRAAPTNAVAYYSRGCIYFRFVYVPVADKDGHVRAQIGDLDKAVEDWKTAKRLEPKYVHPYMAMGMMYAENGEHDRAIAEYTSVIRLAPWNTGAFWARAESYRATRLFDKAVVDYAEAIRLEPKYACAYYGRGSSYHEKGNLDEAIADYSEAIRLDPKLAAAYEGRGRAYERKGDRTKAEKDFAKAKGLSTSRVQREYEWIPAPLKHPRLP